LNVENIKSKRGVFVGKPIVCKLEVLFVQANIFVALQNQ
jgi:hypothetical protein